MNDYEYIESKSIEALSVDDFQKYPAWSWLESDIDDGLVIPIDASSQKEIDVVIELFVFSEIVLLDGSKLEGYVAFDGRGSVYGVTFFKDDSDFDLGRALFEISTFDELSAWLGKEITQITPLTYRTKVPVGNDGVRTGEIDLKTW